ncbi:hypothetical protein KIN20_037997 [Parelaphostrongylus tenuis]|uniref:Uncharacterized protein n=1 Tax=Parelaphostrongylus tenuis TaxID=148309 RepID=A0AAD5REA4_PARTN|nr:hypothetical protein KIN20_037997 [Parelaphostrongylus tenuis]
MVDDLPFLILEKWPENISTAAYQVSVDSNHPGKFRANSKQVVGQYVTFSAGSKCDDIID